jgi:hypothetical protein
LATEEGRVLTEKLRQVAIKFCDLPRNSMSANLNSQKKSAEIKYMASASKLCFMACSLLSTQQSKAEKQALLEVNDLKVRMTQVFKQLEL